MPLPDIPFPARRPWEATWWVGFLQSLGPSFPGPVSPQDQWQHFLGRCSLWPALLLLAGVLAAGSVLLCSCLCRPEGQLRPRRREPSRKPTVCLGFFLLLLIVVGTATCWLTGVRAADTAQDQLGRAIQDATAASNEGDVLVSVGDSLVRALDAVSPACPAAVRPQVQQRVDAVIQDLQEYQHQVDAYRSVVETLPQQLSDVKALGKKVATVIGAGLMAPMGLVFACCVIVLLTVACTRSGNCTGSFVRCQGCSILSPTVLLVSAAAAAQLEVGIVTSSFCVNVDANTLAYIAHAAGANSTTYAVSQYYIASQGTNPLLEAIGRAGVQLQQVNQSMGEFGGVIAQYCPSWDGAATVTEGLATAQDCLAVGKRLLSADNVNRYYDQAIRQDACKTGVIGLAWLVMFQVAVGMLCLPCLASLANCHLKARAQWHNSRDAGAELWPDVAA